MAAIQTTYGLTQAAALEGMQSNMEPCDIVSRVCESAAGIGFGKVACMGARDDTVKVSAASSKFEGITLIDPNVSARNPNAYAQYDTVAVMKRGVVWVSVLVAVAKGDPVYYVPATGVLTNVSTSNTLIPNATFDSTTAGAGLAKLRLNV